LGIFVVTALIGGALRLPMGAAHNEDQLVFLFYLAMVGLIYMFFVHGESFTR
jgi:hypothetical protein